MNPKQKAKKIANSLELASGLAVSHLVYCKPQNNEMPTAAGGLVSRTTNL